jgi:hypothetical protein
MKKLLIFAVAVGAVGAASAQPSVGVSIGINQPGAYGRINIGDVPPPALVYAQPVLVAPPRVVVQRAPIYLYVPPTHQQNWGRYCGRYSACGQPVYFVRDDWVRERYTREHPGWDRGRHRGWDRDGDGRRDRDDRGHGNGRGHGRGHDRD